MFFLQRCTDDEERYAYDIGIHSWIKNDMKKKPKKTTFVFLDKL